MKGTSNIQLATSTADVVTAEQGQLVDRAKAYERGWAASISHSKGYAYLLGRTLLALKEVTPHGQFEALKQAEFPQSHSSLGRFMLFAEAVDYKSPTLGYLKDGQLLLDLPEREKEKLFSEIEKKTGDRGIVETIKEYRAKSRPVHKPTPEEKVADERYAANEFAKTVLGTLNMARQGPGLEQLLSADNELVALIEDARIELGKALAPVFKRRKK